jgi:hypothetical protein
MAISRRGKPALCLFAVTVVACLTPTASAGADRPGGGELSPRLAELAAPEMHGATAGEQARAAGLPRRGPGSLLREGGRLLVEVRFERGAAAGVAELRTAGAEAIDVSRRYQTVTVAALPVELDALAGAPGVAAVTEVLTPVTASTCPAGIAVSEGDSHLRATEARAAFGVNGSGAEVGILSDSFDDDASAETHAEDDVASGDLPGPANACTGQSTPVDVLQDLSDPESSDEGRAMAQIVHDLAPRARISFATAFTGMTAFAGNIEDLAAAGADTIADDVLYFEEPFFQEGPVGIAVSHVADDGVSYFSSAGNNNLIAGGKDIASWEAPQFRATSCPTGVPPYASECMDFDPGPGEDPTLGLTVSPGATLILDLQWAQPWNGVTTDLDAYLLASGKALLEGSESYNVKTTQKPFEFLVWENNTGNVQTVRVAIDRCDLTCDPTGLGDNGTPRVKVALLQNGGGVTASEYPESSGGDVVGPTIFGHNGAEDAISVGAVRFNTTSAPEFFSSRGPVAHYFGPANGSTPAAPLGTPLVLAKPDVAATDGGANTFFGSFSSGVWRFFGTSASAPHAAAVAALLRDADATLTPAEIRAVLSASARPVGAFGPTAVGAGLIDAFAALDEVADPLSPGEEGEKDEEGEEGEEEGRGGEEESGGDEPSGGGGTSPPPSTFFRRRPPKVLRTREPTARAVFVFGSDATEAVFLCRLDRQPFRACHRRVARRLPPGPHVMRVKARDAEGRTDPTPAVSRFRVVPVG